MTIGVCSAASVVSDSVTTLAITDRKNCLVRMGGSSERINLSHEFSNQPDPEGPAATQESPSPHVPKRVVKCSDQALVLSCISDPRLSRGFCGREDSSKAPALKGLVCRTRSDPGGIEFAVPEWPWSGRISHKNLVLPTFNSPLSTCPQTP